MGDRIITSLYCLSLFIGTIYYAPPIRFKRSCVATIILLSLVYFLPIHLIFLRWNCGFFMITLTAGLWKFSAAQKIHYDLEKHCVMYLEVLNNWHNNEILLSRSMRNSTSVYESHFAFYCGIILKCSFVCVIFHFAESFILEVSIFNFIFANMKTWT